jgi:hypothetical protein
VKTNSSMPVMWNVSFLFCILFHTERHCFNYKMLHVQGEDTTI